MNQNNTVSGADVAARVLTFCLLVIGAVLVLSTQTGTDEETHNETHVTGCQCAQTAIQESDQ